MKNLVRKISGLTLLGSMLLLPALAIADRGHGGGDDGDNEGRFGQSVQTLLSTLGIGSNSGPGSANSGPGNMNDVDDEDNSGQGNAGTQLAQSVSSSRGHGSDEARIRVSANGRVEIRGATVTSVSGSTLGITVAGRSFTVDAGAARLQDRDDMALALSSFAVGDEVRVKGVFSPITSTSFIVAEKVVNRSLDNDECLEDEDELFDDDDDGISRRGRDNDDDECVVVNPDVVAPVISAVAAVAGVNSATITWTTNELSTSRVFVSTVSPVDVNASTTLTAASGVLVTAHSVVISGLAASTTYHFIVRSTDAAGNTATSGASSFTTAAAPDTEVPIISAIAAVAGVNSATITWTTNELSTSRVFVSTVSPVDVNASTTLSVANATLVTSHSIVVSGLTASTTYHFIVRSVDAAGNTATSGASSFTTGQVVADTTAPVVSNILAALVSPGTVNLSWTTNEPATSKVFFGTTTPLDLQSASTSFVANASLVVSHVLAIPGLVANTIFHFVIESIDAFGNNATSSDIQILIP